MFAILPIRWHLELKCFLGDLSVIKDEPLLLLAKKIMDFGISHDINHNALLERRLVYRVGVISEF